MSQVTCSVEASWLDEARAKQVAKTVKLRQAFRLNLLGLGFFDDRH
jgi:hypothetical protein